ncbi:GntR family transcriptional regulator [Ruegeria sp. SCP11]|uniref:GntR family transcriptional regulator n=1 Tax=Ruegeria sp. SCP11 TaxID=3141378 RepID=UPI00333C240E
MSPNDSVSRTKTKYQVIADTLMADIENGKLRPGDRLPSEDQLASELGYSLGTVQRALRNLANQGVVVRVHGSGTFVSGARPPEEHLRHFRFRSDDGETLLPVFFETESLEHTADTGPWTQSLGDDPKGYVKIRRLISVNREFEIFSELYLPATRFAPLLEMEFADLDGVSVRDMLADKMNVPTVHTKQTMLCGTFPPRVARLINMPIGMFGLILTIQSETFRRAPIIWQRMFIPPSDREMEMLTEPLHSHSR